MAKTESPRVVIVGAGPIGLEAAVYARSLNLPVTVFERGVPGEYLRQWGHVRLFSPFHMNSTPLGRKAIQRQHPRHELPSDDACITGHEHLERYLQPIAESLGDIVRTQTQVLSIGRSGFLKQEEPGSKDRARHPFRLLIRDAKQRERVEEADVVLDCTGTYGQHRWLGEGGIPAVGELTAEPHISYHLTNLKERMAQFLGKTIMLVGGGYSAATTAVMLATLAKEDTATWIFWLARSSRSQPIRRFGNDPLRERDRLAADANNLATRNDGSLEYHPQTFVEAVEFHGADKGFTVRSRTAGSRQSWEVDHLIANVGYQPDEQLYRELQIHQCYASEGPMKLAASLLGQKSQDCLKQTSGGADTLKNPEPNFYILGAKSYGRNSNFLLRIGFEQIRDVFSMIANDPKLDLYR